MGRDPTKKMQAWWNQQCQVPLHENKILKLKPAHKAPTKQKRLKYYGTCRKKNGSTKTVLNKPFTRICQIRTHKQTGQLHRVHLRQQTENRPLQKPACRHLAKRKPLWSIPTPCSVGDITNVTHVHETNERNTETTAIHHTQRALPRCVSEHSPWQGWRGWSVKMTCQWNVAIRSKARGLPLKEDITARVYRPFKRWK